MSRKNSSFVSTPQNCVHHNLSYRGIYSSLGEKMEYDVYLRMNSDDVHTLSYILEVEDNLLNMRKYQNGLLRILVPADLLDQLLGFLQNVRSYVNFELVDVRLNRGII